MKVSGASESMESTRTSAGSARSCCEVRDWSSLAAELFGLVLQRVQERGCEDGEEGRRVVAMAGVCRYWRELVLHHTSGKCLSHNGFIQFPSVLTKPGPRLQPLQCFFKRKGSVITLFQSSPADNRRREFLMAARWRWHPGGCIYDLTTNRKSFSQDAPGYLGKLKSDFWGTCFVLQSCTGPVAVISFSKHSVERGLCQRRIECKILPQTSAITQPFSDLLTAGPTQVPESPFQPSAFRSWNAGWNYVSVKLKRILGASKRSINKQTLDFQRIDSTFWRQTEDDEPHGRCVTTDEEVVADTLSPVQVKSKIPLWDERQRCWVLDFKRSDTLPSMHNFQLILAENSIDEISSASQEENATSKQEDIILQVTKIKGGLYAMGFCYPLSAFQALAVCLGSFSTTVCA